MRYTNNPTGTKDRALQRLEEIWSELGIERAVLVQGSAHGQDHDAMLDAIAKSPTSRRGVALLHNTVTNQELERLHYGGVRAVRFNWISHLLSKDSLTETERMRDAAELLLKIWPLDWHVEFHIDIADINLIAKVQVPDGMPVVIDHMARIDIASAMLTEHIETLIAFLEQQRCWLKISGADRLAARVSDLRVVIPTMRELLQVVSDRCVWGLDWPHVNLANLRPDSSSIETLLEITDGSTFLEQVLVANPSRLYDFPGIDPSVQ